MSENRTARVLDEAKGLRAMVWVMAIMLFLTVLAAALGLGTASAGRLLDRQLAGRLTVQIVGGDARISDAAAATLLTRLQRMPEVTRAVPVPRADLVQLLRPWLGEAADDGELPIPAMIDVDLRDPGDSTVARVAEHVRTASPLARVDRHQSWMSPVSGLMRTFTWLAAGLVALLALATAIVVVLTARAGLEAHRGTIEVMHMLGSTDLQVARLFQRRIVRDAALGGWVGAAAAIGLAALIGGQLSRLGSELVGGILLSPVDWAALAALPLLFMGVATLAARWTVTRALRRTL